MNDQAPSFFAPGGLLSEGMKAFEPRPAQARMANGVRLALDEKKLLAVEAGTGTGKTLAYLMPILEREIPFIVSTATKALQDQIIFKDVPLVRRVTGWRFDAVVLKGRSNYLCIHRFRTFQRAPFFIRKHEEKAFGAVEEWAVRTASGDRDELAELPEKAFFWPEVSTNGDNCEGSKCPEFERCFLKRARDRAKAADVLVVNHHLFFADMAVREGGFGEILPRRKVVVFDEAHQVPDVVTRYFGAEISNHRLTELTRDVRRELDSVGGGDPPLLDALDKVEHAAQQLRQAFPMEDARDGLREDVLRGSAGRSMEFCEAALKAMLEAIEPHRARSSGLAGGGRRCEALLEASGEIRSLEDDSRVYWFETRGKGVFLQASPLEIGPTLGKLLFPELDAAIFTSATLATSPDPKGFAFFGRQMGFPEERMITGGLPPPFDYENQALLYLPTDLPPPNDGVFPEAVTERLFEILTATRGRAFCLFTSYRVLNAVKDGLAGRLPYRILVQGEKPKGALLEEFKADVSSVLLATSAFWEGVDVPGEALSAVIIDKLPFASPGDPLVAARSRFHEAQGGNAFKDIHVPKAILALKQGLGRLLRRRGDRGVMAVLDVRVTTKSYGRRFVTGLPPAPITRDLADVENFFFDLASEEVRPEVDKLDQDIYVSNGK